MKSERKALIRALALCAVATSISGMSLAAVTSANAVTSSATPSTATTAKANPGAAHRSIDTVDSQVLLNGELMQVDAKKSGWTSRNAVCVLRPHAQEVINLSGTTSKGTEKLSMTFNKTQIGPQVKSLTINGARDDAVVRAQTVKFTPIDGTRDLAQVNLLTDSGQTIQFNLIGVR